MPISINRKKRRGRPPVSKEKRFWDKVVKQEDGCWLFTSNHGGGDYGMLTVKTGESLAHRISWEIHKGPIPEGIKVLHTCDIPKCVNPDHLFLGTSQDNMDDMVNKGRSSRGESHPSVKLLETDVLEIRRLYATGKWSQQKLAVLYRVNQTNIGFIVRRVHWSHI